MDDCILQVKNLNKSFGKQQCSRTSTLICARRNHALIWQNGSGKTLLSNILYGVEGIDSGEILFNGEPVRIKSPAHAVKMGIAVLTQEMNVYPDRDIAHNVWTNHEPTNALMVDRALLYKRTERLLEQLEIPLDPHEQVSHLGLAERQMYSLPGCSLPNRVLSSSDEPTEVLDMHYSACCSGSFSVSRPRAYLVVYITHRIDEITRVCDRVSIMKEQTIVETMAVDECDVHRLITKLFGHIETSAYPKLNVKLGDELLRVCKPFLWQHSARH